MAATYSSDVGPSKELVPKAIGRISGLGFGPDGAFAPSGTFEDLRVAATVAALIIIPAGGDRSAQRTLGAVLASSIQAMGYMSMSSEAVATVVKMMESLSEPAQDQVVEHLRDYLMEVQDELRWDKLLNGTQDKLVAMAQRARAEIAEGKARPLDYSEL